MTQNHSGARVLGMLLVPFLFSGLILTCTVGHVRTTMFRAPAAEGRQAYDDEAAVLSTVLATPSDCGPEILSSLTVRLPSPSPLPSAAP
ncbi:hypothetical protein [Streptomyces sp. NPDC005374]|uniref:hypothetical protein n=1 Tax=Streptomyces sp. NPDC005374 TaxID=3364713 RepID=UPI0036A811BE